MEQIFPTSDRIPQPGDVWQQGVWQGKYCTVISRLVKEVNEKKNYILIDMGYGRLDTVQLDCFVREWVCESKIEESEWKGEYVGSVTGVI